MTSVETQESYDAAAKEIESDLLKAKTRLLELTLTALRISTEAVQTVFKPSNNEDVTKDVLPQLTLREVSEHDQYNDCWIVIYDKVYDVTEFLNSHPGGSDLLLEYAGLDASIAFRGAGHTQDALKMLKKFEIGELPPHEQIFRCAKGALSFARGLE